MAAYDGHPAKRQRTDYDGGRNGYGGSGNGYFNKGGSRQPMDGKPNHILLITVINPAYPITTEVVHTICKPNGTVLRIVIFKKNGVQAMVEFDSIESAERAKNLLNGCDIYSGCCTLKIEYAKPTRLNVFKNDNESWDYTNSNIGKMGNPDRPALLQEPPNAFPSGGNIGPYGEGVGGGRGPMPNQSFDRGFNDGGFNSGPPRGGPHDHFGGPTGRDQFGGPGSSERFGREMFGREGPHGGPGFNPNMQMPPPGSNQQGLVMMAYGLNHKKMNADHLFNILCLYGNVCRVKFLKSKEGCAMVQMGDPIAVERAMTHLNGCVFFDCKLQLGFSKQEYLNNVQRPYELPDGTQSFKEFVGSRNNRFTTPEAAGKNRILAPSNVLHFFNAPFGITEEEIKKVFEEGEATPPVTVKLFTPKNKSERSASGLLEFENQPKALEALCLCNHVSIPNPNGNYPFILKLCFSSSGPRGSRGGANF